jgi:hypothetical protein
VPICTLYTTLLTGCQVSC